MSYRLNIVLIGAGLLSLSAGAMAQLSAVPTSATPTNTPGKISPATRTQLQTRLEQRFDSADANHDGILTPQERAASRTSRNTEHRDIMRERIFARLDANKDGAISKDEFSAARPPRGPDHAMARGHQRHRFASAMMMRRQHFAFADKPIARSDFVGAGLSQFDKVDTDHDGKLTPAERDAGRKVVRDRLAPAQMPPPLPPGS